jgi:hypothetical protein
MNILRRALPYVAGSFAVASVLATSASPASAVSITLGSKTYKIQLVTGTQASLNSLLQKQPWWTGVVNASPASLPALAANQVQGKLGFPNQSSTWGPFFAYNVTGTTFSHWRYTSSKTLVNSTAFSTTSALRTFAVIVPWSTDSWVMLIATGAFGAGVIAKRKMARKTLLDPASDVNLVDSAVS